MKLRNYLVGTLTTAGLAFLAWLALSVIADGGRLTAVERDQLHIQQSLDKMDSKLDRIERRLDRRLP